VVVSLLLLPLAGRGAAAAAAEHMWSVPRVIRQEFGGGGVTGMAAWRGRRGGGGEVLPAWMLGGRGGGNGRVAGAAKEWGTDRRAA
jgi:hypothetical protein